MATNDTVVATAAAAAATDDDNKSEFKHNMVSCYKD
jgi:hypothetical protein